MCGIVTLLSLKQGGFYGNDLDMFQEMLLVDSLRGPDSTGAFCVHRNMQVSGVKHASNPYNTFTSNVWHTFRADAIRNGRLLVGHNRKATHGTINNANSHPFHEDHIVLVHNGMLQNHKNKLADREVDSHAMAAAIAKAKPEEIPQLIADVDGAFAFVWWDMNQEKLFFVRNEQRPLSIIRTNDHIILCSEAWMGNGVLRRKESQLKNEDINIYNTIPLTLYSYNLKGELFSEELPAKKVSTTVMGTAPVVRTSVPTAPHGTKNTNTGGNTQVATAMGAAFNKVHSATVQVFENKDDTLPFQKGEQVMVRITHCTDMEHDGKRRLRALGRVSQLGKPSYDVSGFLPEVVDIGDVQDWVGKVVRAQVMEVHPHLTAGPSLKCMGFAHVSHLVEKSWNGLFLHELEWRRIAEQCKCKHCNGKVQPFEREFTNVKTFANDVIEIICADCVEDRIENEEIKNSFVERRVAALDNWKPECEEPANRAKPPLQLQGPTTLQ